LHVDELQVGLMTQITLFKGAVSGEQQRTNLFGNSVIEIQDVLKMN
jgi:hypothetical protein